MTNIDAIFYRDSLADSLLNQKFNPTTENQVWVADITYLEQVKAVYI
ncbi:hypothetical protein J8M20_16475 [Pseudoalteromonas luteoviolacea]|nr:hypothetical protein [Pseudoalteromonas luteoviolacea]MBQ4812958.1 hypothetical protein [Pseudoalteromonas luteoviolacea]